MPSRLFLVLVTMIGTVLLGAAVVLGCSSGSTPATPGADASGMDAVTFDVTTSSDGGDGATGHDSAGDVTGDSKAGTSDSGIAVQVLGQSGALTTQQERDFFAVVTGTTNTAVTWSVVEAQGGTVTTSGHYTAPGAAGTYHVAATSQADSTASGQVAVDVVAPPVATLTVPGIVTTGATGLMASVPTQSGTTYAWTMTGGTITAGAGTSAITFTAGAPATIVVSCVVTNAAGSTATGTADVIISSTPVVSISAPSSATTGTTGLVASVPAQAGASYAWTITGGTITAGGGTSSVTFTAGVVGTLTLQCTVTVGGTPTNGSANVTVVATPVAVVTAPATAGVGATGLAASVATQAGMTYTWSISGGTITAGAGTSAVTFTAGSAGSLTLTCTVQNAAGASASGNAIVAVVAGPTTPTISAPSEATAGTTGLAASVAVQVGSTYAWTITGGTITSATNSATIVFTAGAVGTLTLNVTITNAAGSASASANVTIVSAPVVAITAPSTAASGATGLVASVGSQSGATYAWTITGGTITGGQGTDQISFAAGAAGNLTLGCTVIIAGTPTSGTAVVTVVDAPTTPTISAPSEATAGTTGLVASVTPQTGVTYAWTITGGTITSATNDATIVFTAGSLPGPVALGVSVTNAVGTANASANVTLVAAPVVSITAPPTATPGQAGLTAFVPSQAGDTYVWTITDGAITAGQGTNSITFTAGTTGTLALGCTVTNTAMTMTSGTANVVVGATASLTVNISGIPANGSVTVSGPSNFSSTINATQTLSGLAAGTYSVTAPNAVLGYYTYSATVVGSPATLNGGDSATVTVTYTATDEPPTISTIADQTVYTNSTITVPFTIGDPQGSALTLTGSAGTTGVVTWSFGGSGDYPTLILTGGTAAGSTTFTVTATDPLGVYTTSMQFTVTVLPAIVTNNNDSGAGSLRYVLSQVSVGATVTFDPSLVGGMINLLSTITISQDVTITGPVASTITVSGGGSVQLFVITGGNTAISGLTLTGGNAGSSEGGAILAEGSTLTITRCAFTSNTSPSNYGGAIVVDGAPLTVTNSTFTSNNGGLGAAIANFGNGSTVTGCTFTLNNATSAGGAIQNANKLTITGSTFMSNSAVRGGAIYNDGMGTITVSGSTFTSNTASGVGGGAIYNTSQNSFTLVDSTFTSNTAPGTSGDGYGGAVYNDYNSTLAVTGSTFASNSAVLGGAVVNYAPLTIGASTFTSNTASTKSAGGGALSLVFGSSTVTNATFYGNACQNGAAIWAASSPTLSNVTVSGNTGGVALYADVGGGVAFQVQNSIIAGNPSGDLSGTLTSGGYNVFGTSPGGTSGTDLTNVSSASLALGPLSNCGGPTQTMPVSSSSAAFELVPIAGCTVTTDQRGDPRPGFAGQPCTAGAFELQSGDVCP